jgi:hypothetical protein
MLLFSCILFVRSNSGNISENFTYLNVSEEPTTGEPTHGRLMSPHSSNVSDQWISCF